MLLTYRLLLLLGCLAIAAQAFNTSGHMLVADIAWLGLAEATRTAIIAILKKARGEFKLTGSDATTARSKFDLAATFPDELKGNKNTGYEPLISPMNLLFQTAAQAKKLGNEGTRCKTWHYLDTPLFVPAGVTPENNSSNLVVAHNEGTLRLKQLRQNKYNGPTVTGMTKDDLKFWWLAWLLHMTGDAHQPLHCASNYSVPGNEGKPDAGGNKFTLSNGQKLHGYWDGVLDNAAGDDGFSIGDAPKSSQPANVLAPLSQEWRSSVQVKIGNCATLDPATWVAEGGGFAQNIAYSGVQAQGSLSTAYKTKAKKHIRQAAVLGGCRLAKVLTEALG